jgi:hypothetical protein
MFPRVCKACGEISDEIRVTIVGLPTLRIGDD